MHGGSSYTMVIGNITQQVSNENQTFAITADQNYANTNSSYSIIALVGLTIPLKSSSIINRLKKEMQKRKKRKGLEMEIIEEK